VSRSERSSGSGTHFREDAQAAGHSAYDRGPGENAARVKIIAKVPWPELQNVMIKLNKLASHHGTNAIRSEKSGTEIRFQFLRIQDAFFDAFKRRKQNNLPPAR
jgi:hypothetical protein